MDKAGAITYGKPSEQKTLIRHQECRLKRSGLRQSLNNAREQRPGVHIQTSLFTIIVKDIGYHPIAGDKAYLKFRSYILHCNVNCPMTSSIFCV